MIEKTDRGKSRAKRLRMSLPIAWGASCAAAILGSLLCGKTVPGAEAQSQPAGNKPPPRIQVQDWQGIRIASTDGQNRLSPAALAKLAFERDYQPGDRILVTGPRFIVIQLDEHMPECRLFLADGVHRLSFEIPHGREEAQTGSAYAPDAFAGESHWITARGLTTREVGLYRNLALNPCDQPGSDGLAANSQVQQWPGPFPHASSNSVTRESPEFGARNAIDGVIQNGRHGPWPYQSWGPERRDDLWWQIDFGRLVEVDKIRLLSRADFPHDSYFQSAVVEFSDGGRLPIRMNDSAGFQEFSFTPRRVSWIRLTNLVAADPTKYSSFVEIEAWGRDLQ
jgi:F5/8 type C domain